MDHIGHCFFLKTGLMLVFEINTNRDREQTKGSLYKDHEAKLELFFRKTETTRETYMNLIKKD
jgi:hypothetical protein